jgi:hypothetical protein
MYLRNYHAARLSACNSPAGIGENHARALAASRAADLSRHRASPGAFLTHSRVQSSTIRIPTRRGTLRERMTTEEDKKSIPVV